ncbi:MAG: tetratricopeptide repeat protein [Anaerolineales bacterium]|jgi:tetratricopeptide (TPR) repeat protein
MNELEIWNELGNIYFNTGAYDEAVRTYLKAIELDHGCGQSFSNLAYIYMRQGRYADAIPMLENGIELLEEAGSQAVLWNQMGEAYLRLEDYNNAIASYRKAAELDPENLAYQDNLAEAELDGQRSDSQPITKTEAPQAETASWVFKNQRLVYPAEEESSGASQGSPVILGSRILADAPNQVNTPQDNSRLAGNFSPTGQLHGETPTNANADGLLRLGLKHWHRKEYEKAIRFLETALDTVFRPKDNFLEALCHYAIALVETDLGKIVEAIQSYQSAASLAPEHIFPWNSLGNLNCMLDRYDDALAAFREGIEHNPKDAISWNGLGDVYHKLGRFEDAIAAYQLANVFDKQVLEQDALKEYEKSIEASLKNPEVWNEAGNIYYRTGAYDDAVESYRKAVELEPANATFQANLAKAKQSADQSKEEASQLDGAERAEISLENLQHSESTFAKTVSAESEEEMAIAPGTDGTEQTSEEQSLPEKLSGQPGKTAGSESEAPYWVFPKEPAPLYSTVDSGTLAGSREPVPAYAKRLLPKPTFMNDSARSDSNMDSTALMVQMTPRSENAIKTEDTIRPSVAENDQKNTSEEVDTEVPQPSADPPATSSDNPVQPANLPDNQAGDQASVNGHVLENDITAYRRITELNPRNDRAWDVLGNTYEAAGRHDEAISAFEQAIALSPRKETYHFHLGMAHASQMNFDKAIAALENSIAMNPNFVLGHCALAANYRRVGNEAEAQKHIEIARPSMEYEKEYNRACFESISGNADEAFALLEKALDKDQLQIAMLRTDPDLDFIRSDARLEALIDKVTNLSK